MESFLDEYQLVRTGLGIAGMIYVGIVVLLGGWETRFSPIVVVLFVVTGHAIWCRAKGIRTPRLMLLLDLTLWGWVMSVPDERLTVATASFAFLTLMIVLFSDGVWTIAFLCYVSAWYGYATFSQTSIDPDTLNGFIAVVFTMACVAVVVSHVKRWLGRLDANRSQMMGTVSHELRNNLTGMIGITDLVDSGADLDPDQVQELLGLANQQAIDAAEIVEDLLTASRLESSALDVGTEAVDVNAEVTTVVRRFAGEGTQVSADVDPGLPTAVADSLRVRQILRNLISNAVRYGGSTITVATGFTGDTIEVIVCDDGDGVPRDDESTIFLPYRRSTITKRHASSVGLGLWICRQLASAMGGHLEYRRSGGLTEFVLSLKVNEDNTASTMGARTSQQSIPVLLGDDRVSPAVTLS
jgi:signal transduction histidine kinase